MWGPVTLQPEAAASNPLPGLVAAGERLDPGLFDVDLDGAITAFPRRNGNFSLWLLLEDTVGILVLPFATSL
jgi:hypothetical protein